MDKLCNLELLIDSGLAQWGRTALTDSDYLLPAQFIYSTNGGMTWACVDFEIFDGNYKEMAFKEWTRRYNAWHPTRKLEWRRLNREQRDKALHSYMEARKVTEQ